MAIDKAVDSTQLNSDLTSVANAIRTKGGTSAQLAFPAEFIYAINAIQGGGSNWTLLASQEFTVSTTSTSNALAGNIELPYPDYVDAQTVLWVHIRDKAGKRDGYFYGNDSIFFHYQLATGNTNSLTVRPLMQFRVTSDQAYAAAATAYGVYPYRLYYTSSSHYVQIYRRYSSTSTGTIDGTYKCDVYKLTMPDGMTLFT